MEYTGAHKNDFMARGYGPLALALQSLGRGGLTKGRKVEYATLGTNMIPWLFIADRLGPWADCQAFRIFSMGKHYPFKITFP
jgi:hypothetical protein